MQIERRLRDRNADTAAQRRVAKLFALASLVTGVLFLLIHYYRSR